MHRWDNYCFSLHLLSSSGNLRRQNHIGRRGWCFCWKSTQRLGVCQWIAKLSLKWDVNRRTRLSRREAAAAGGNDTAPTGRTDGWLATSATKLIGATERVNAAPVADRRSGHWRTNLRSWKDVALASSADISSMSLNPCLRPFTHSSKSIQKKPKQCLKLARMTRPCVTGQHVQWPLHSAVHKALVWFSVPHIDKKPQQQQQQQQQQ